MRATELYRRVSRRTLAEADPELVRLILQAFTEEMRLWVREGQRVSVPGLGVFRARKYRARVVAHAGRSHKVPARLVLTFRAARSTRVLAVEEG